MRLRVGEPKSVSKDLQPHCLEAIKGKLVQTVCQSQRGSVACFGQHTPQCKATYVSLVYACHKSYTDMLFLWCGKT